MEAWRTSDAPIGKYIINESFEASQSSVKSITRDTRTGKPVGHAVFQSGGVRNRNGRIYLTEDLAREVTCTRTIELINTRNLFCEAGHPMDVSLQRQSTIDWRNSNCKILVIGMNGNNVEGNFTPSNTQYGKAFEQDLLEGTIPAFSLRALGSIRQTKLGAQVTDLRMITYDQVIYPSHSNAYMTNLLSESVDVILNYTPINESAIHEVDELNGCNRMIPVTSLTEADKSSIVDFVKCNSNNMKFITDYMNAKLENVSINKKGTQVILREAGSENLIYINIESYIHNELMNYSEKMKDLYK